MINNLLSPYKELLKYITAGGIACLLFIGGCDHGEGKSADKIAGLESQVRTLQEANQDFVDAEDLRKEELDKALQEAKAWLSLADRAAEDLEKEREKVKREASKREKDLRDAYNSPDCAPLLQELVCKSVPLP